MFAGCRGIVFARSRRRKCRGRSGISRKAALDIAAYGGTRSRYQKSGLGGWSQDAGGEAAGGEAVGRRDAARRVDAGGAAADATATFPRAHTSTCSSACPTALLVRCSFALRHLNVARM